jgi:hypothetical protein
MWKYLNSNLTVSFVIAAGLIISSWIYAGRNRPATPPPSRPLATAVDASMPVALAAPSQGTGDVVVVQYVRDGCSWCEKAKTTIEPMLAALARQNKIRWTSLKDPVGVAEARSAFTFSGTPTYLVGRTSGSGRLVAKVVNGADRPALVQALNKYGITFEKGTE